MSSFPEARSFVKKYTSIRVKSDHVKASLWCFGRSCSICWIIGMTGMTSSSKAVMRSFYAINRQSREKPTAHATKEGKSCQMECAKYSEQLFGMLLDLQRIADHITFSLIAIDGGGAAVFSWLGESKAGERLGLSHQNGTTFRTLARYASFQPHFNRLV